jgi:predicted aspartyl protease
LLDTGAAASLIDENAVPSSATWDSNASRPHLIDASGNRIAVKGTVVTELGLGKQRVRIVANVVPAGTLPTPVLLGMPTLTTAGNLAVKACRTAA